MRGFYTIEAWDTSYNAGSAPYTLSTTTKPTSSTPTLNRTTAYTYDGAGHTTSVTAVMPTGADNQTTEYDYGVTGGGYTGVSDIYSNDLLYMVKYPDKSTGIASSSSSDQVTYTYNTRGEVITRTDQNATVHTYGYDGLGDQLDEWVVPGSGVDDVIVHIHSTYSGYFTNTAVSYNGSSTITDTVQRFYNSFGQPPALQRPDARPPPLPTPFHALRLYLFP